MSLFKRTTNLIKGKMGKSGYTDRGERVSNQELEAELQKLRSIPKPKSPKVVAGEKPAIVKEKNRKKKNL